MSSKPKPLEGFNILLGVAGGIAAYKAVDLASKLTQAGGSVKTVMTASACELIRPKSFEAVTGNIVYTSLWESEYQIGHIKLVDLADIVVIVPATANIIAKLANGICDDLLSTVVCACWAKPVLVAPAMNEAMWKNPAVQNNIGKIKQLKFRLIGPEKGRLACGAEGVGRMSEPADILAAIEALAGGLKK